MLSAGIRVAAFIFVVASLVEVYGQGPPLHISAQLAQTMLLNRVPPVYPPIAKKARVQGTVLLSPLIARDGSVKQLNVISGPAMLRQAALDAVRQWTYRPYLLNGQPVEVFTEVEVNFSLQP
jgi:periplasmic protein TonB